MADHSIIVKNVSKDYSVRHNNGYSLKSRFVGLFTNRYKERIENFRALNDISFAVERGTCLGVTGPNGSGKSTLLKLVAGIIHPTEGEIILDPGARVGTMIQLGVGFNHELTGAENIFLNASLYGFPRAYVEERYDEIVKFSGLNGFIDTSIKNYSSGMYARLGFSVTVHLDVDILLIDEILGVGDTSFKQKCLKKLNEYKEQGKTILFVSHSEAAIKKFCDRKIVLNNGDCRLD